MERNWSVHHVENNSWATQNKIISRNIKGFSLFTVFFRDEQRYIYYVTRTNNVLLCPLLAIQVREKKKKGKGKAKREKNNKHKVHIKRNANYARRGESNIHRGQNVH